MSSRTQSTKGLPELICSKRNPCYSTPGFTQILSTVQSARKNSSGWANVSRVGDLNLLHHHADATVATVFYAKARERERDRDRDSLSIKHTTNTHGCGSKPMVPLWGRYTTHFRTYFSGWIGMFTGGTIWILTTATLGLYYANPFLQPFGFPHFRSCQFGAKSQLFCPVLRVETGGSGA